MHTLYQYHLAVISASVRVFIFPYFLNTLRALEAIAQCMQNEVLCLERPHDQPPTTPNRDVTVIAQESMRLSPLVVLGPSPPLLPPAVVVRSVLGTFVVQLVPWVLPKRKDFFFSNTRYFPKDHDGSDWDSLLGYGVGSEAAALASKEWNCTCHLHFPPGSVSKRLFPRV